MTGGYRRDAMTFVEHLLTAEDVRDTATRRGLTLWWQERSGPAPLSSHPLARFARRARLVLSGG